MNIRNDMRLGRRTPPALHDDQWAERDSVYGYYDRVLINCRECGRNHLAALTCPPANAPLIRRLGVMIVDEPEWHAEKVAA